MHYANYFRSDAQKNHNKIETLYWLLDCYLSYLSAI